MKKHHFEELLRANGFKSTSGRIEILESLEKTHTPLTIAALYKKLSKKIDQATLYRTLNDLVEAGLVSRILINPEAAHYELALGRDHHHHLVCENCGTIDDLPCMDIEKLYGKAVKNASNFSAINNHSLEFFGICKLCAVASK